MPHTRSMRIQLACASKPMDLKQDRRRRNTMPAVSAHLCANATLECLNKRKASFEHVPSLPRNPLKITPCSEDEWLQAGWTAPKIDASGRIG